MKVVPGSSCNGTVAEKMYSLLKKLAFKMENGVCQSGKMPEGWDKQEDAERVADSYIERAASGTLALTSCQGH